MGGARTMKLRILLLTALAALAAPVWAGSSLGPVKMVMAHHGNIAVFSIGILPTTTANHRAVRLKISGQSAFPPIGARRCIRCCSPRCRRASLCTSMEPENVRPGAIGRPRHGLRLREPTQKTCCDPADEGLVAVIEAVRPGARVQVLDRTEAFDAKEEAQARGDCCEAPHREVLHFAAPSLDAGLSQPAALEERAEIV